MVYNAIHIEEQQVKVGVQYRSFTSNDFLNRDLTRLQDAHIQLLRIGFVNYSSGSNLDSLIPVVFSEGLEIIGCLQNASLGPSNTADPTAWGNYVYNVVSAFKSYVKVWEIWNEPENQVDLPSGFPTDLTLNAQKYVQWLQVAYTRAKQADPTCTILGGAQSNLQPDRLTWLTNIFANGAGAYMDALSLHPYCENKSPLPPTMTGGAKAFWKVGPSIYYSTSAKQIMENAGFPAKHIWITEMGWKDAYTSDPAFTENTQAQYLTDALAYAKDNWPWLDAFVIYQWIDYGDTFGLLNSDASLKPAYSGVKAFNEVNPPCPDGYHWDGTQCVLDVTPPSMSPMLLLVIVGLVLLQQNPPKSCSSSFYGQK